MTDPYAVLGVSSGSTDEEITRAYRALARKYHPDLHPGDKRAEANMKNLNAAYMQIQDMRSGKSARSSEGWGGSAEADSGHASRTGGYGYGSAPNGAGGGFYGNNGGYGTDPFGGFYGGFNPNRGYRRRVSYGGFGLFGFPFIRIVLGIIILRFVIGVIFMLLSGLSGQSEYPRQYMSAAYSVESSQTAKTAETAETAETEEYFKV